MKTNIIDYVLNSEKRVISPIGGGVKAFEFMCMSFITIAQAMGFEIEVISDHLNIVREGQLDDRKKLDELISGKHLDMSFFQNEVDYLSMLSEWDYFEYYGGGCFGPLTIAGSILGVDKMLRMLIKNPDFVEDLVSYITDILIMLACKEKEVGMDFFWIAEPDASLVSSEMFWRFSGKYIKKIFAASETVGILHVCGNTLKHTENMERTGAKILSIDYLTDIRQCLEMVAPDTIIMGNLSPITLRYGNVDDVAAETELMLEYCKGYRNYVVSTGCAIIDDTPEENLDVLFRLAEKDTIY